MKYLLFILFIIPSNTYSSTRISVIRISDNKLVAGDKGNGVTIDSLRQKMLSKGIDIIDSSKYSIKIEDSTQEDLNKKIVREEKSEAQGSIKSFNCLSLDKSSSNGRYIYNLCKVFGEK